MREVGIGVGITKDGNIGWVMTPEFEERVWTELQLHYSDDELLDEVLDARLQAGLKRWRG